MSGRHAWPKENLASAQSEKGCVCVCEPLSRDDFLKMEGYPRVQAVKCGGENQGKARGGEGKGRAVVKVKKKESDFLPI